MKVGNVSQTVLKRSVLKQLHTKREEILSTPSEEEMCTVLCTNPKEDVVTTSATVFGNSKSVGVYAVLKAVLDLETRGASAIGVSIQVILPSHAYESRLKEMVRQMEDICAKMNVEITCAKAEVSPAVSQSLVTVSAIGTVGKKQVISCKNIKPNQDIVLCGCIGLEGMLRILDEEENELSHRFIPTFIKQMKNLKEQIFIHEAVCMAQPYVTGMQQIGAGGVFAALWELTQASQLGLKIDMQKLTICQETVEVCEYYYLNPYQMTSTGSVLMVTENGTQLVQILNEMGIKASLIGVTTAENAKVITSGEEIRYLDKPQPDELMIWWERKKEQSMKEGNYESGNRA